MDFAFSTGSGVRYDGISERPERAPAVCVCAALRWNDHSLWEGILQGRLLQKSPQLSAGSR